MANSINTKSEQSVLQRLNDSLGMTDSDLNEMKLLYDFFVKISDPEISDNEVRRLWDEIDYNLLEKYVLRSKGSSKLNLRAASENKQELMQAVEYFFDITSDTISFGSNLPSHIESLEMIAPLKDPSFTLMVGCLTASSKYEYVIGIKSKFPQIKPLIIDIDGISTIKPVSNEIMTLADGVRLPFRNNLLTGIFTSSLIQNLYNDHRESEIRSLFAEMHRTLIEGGIISLVESFPENQDMAEFVRDLKTHLSNLGFKDIKIEFSRGFKTRRHIYEYIDNMSPEIIADPSQVKITARK